MISSLSTPSIVGPVDAAHVFNISQSFSSLRGYPPRDNFPSVQIGGQSLTPQPPAPPDPNASTTERLAALLRPLPPRADGFFAQLARDAYAQWAS
jgi:hypothetical protein